MAGTTRRILRRLKVAQTAAVVAALATPATVLAATNPPKQVEKLPPRFAAGNCTSDGNSVRIGVVSPAGDMPQALRADSLAQGISDFLACPTVVVPARNQSDIVFDLLVHKIDVAVLDPAALIVANRIARPTIAGTLSTAVDTPALGPRATLWVRKNGTKSKQLRLRELKGKRIALGPELGALSDVWPKAALVRSGLVANRNFEVVHLGSDRHSVSALRRGKVDAALTWAGGSAPDATAIWTSRRLPASTIVVRAGVPISIRRPLIAAIKTLGSAPLQAISDPAGIKHVAGVLSVPLELYGETAAQLDSLSSAGLRP